MLRVIGNDINLPRQEPVIASGTLPSGKPVAVNADGTVSVVSGSSATQALGSATVFEAASTLEMESAFDSNSNKIVIAYRDGGNSDHGTAIVGTVSGTSISFGSAVVFNAGQTTQINVVFDTSNNKIVISYKNDSSSDNGTAIVGTVSGTSISFGTAVEFETSDAGNQGAVFDSTNNKVVVFFRDGGNSNYGTAIVGTVSGTSISFGTKVVFTSTNLQHPSIGFDSSNGKVVIAYQDISDSDKGKGIVGTVNGTSISFGSAVVFNSGSTTYTSTAYDSNAQKIVIVYRDDGNSDHGTSVVGTVSGTSISFGSEVVFNAANTAFGKVVYDSTAKKIVIAYQDGGNSDYGTVISGTVSGTSISYDSEAVFESATVAYTAVAYDSNAEKVVIAYRDYGNSSHGTSVVFQTGYNNTNLTSENYIGMSRGVAVPNTTGAKVSFESGTMGSEAIGAAYDPDTGKIILAYQDQDNSYYGTAVVATVSGTSISFGTPVVFQSSKTKDFCTVYDTANNKVVITFCNEASNDAGTGIVGTVSGTSISFGSTATFDGSGANGPHTLAYDANAQKVVVAYRDTSESSYGKAAVGTVSGTSISFGSLVKFNGNNATNSISAVYDSSAQKVVIAFADGDGGNYYGSAIVGTISGTSISFGTKAAFNSSDTDDMYAAYDSTNNKIVMTYKDGSDSDKGKAVVATVSGTSISFGTVVEFVSHVGSNYNCAYDAASGSIIINYGVSSGQGRFITGKVSGTSIGNFSDPYSYYGDTNRVIRPTLVIDIGTGNSVIAFKDQDDNNKGSSMVTDFGVAAEVASGQAVLVDIIGSVSDNQGGLTTGQSYFVQKDGTLGTTADSPSVFAGTAISATKLIVKG